MTSDRPTMPAALRRLWGVDEPPRRGRPAELDLVRIVEAAIGIADAEGLAAVSMSRVAAALGYTTMSLYRHVASKDELILLMMDLASGDPPHLEGGWREALRTWALGFVTVCQRHPWICRVTITGPPMGPHQVAWMEAAMAAMRHTGLPHPARLGILLLIDGHVRGSMALAQDLATGRQASGDAEQDVGAAWASTLAPVVGAGTHPEMHTLLHGVAAGAPPETDDDEVALLFGLEIILDGVGALIRSMSANGSDAE